MIVYDPNMFKNMEKWFDKDDDLNIWVSIIVLILAVVIGSSPMWVTLLLYGW